MKAVKKTTKERLVITRQGNQVITHYSEHFISITTFNNSKDSKKEFSKHRQGHKQV